MTIHLSEAGYEQTREKLAGLQRRLSDLADRTDLSTEHLAEVRHSYERMIRQYQREIKLYEAANAPKQRSV